MKEEKGGYIHILFIFIGLTLLAVGILYQFSDEKIPLNEEPVYTNNEEENEENDEEDEDVISRLSIIENIESIITLKNDDKVTVEYKVDQITKEGEFLYNGEVAFKTSNEDTCDEFFLYNNSIITYCSSEKIYFIDSNGNAADISSFYDNEYEMIPKKLTLSDGKLILTAHRNITDTLLSTSSSQVDLCIEEDVNNNNISLDSIYIGKYQIEQVKDKYKINFLEKNITLQEFIAEKCKIVE